MILNKEDIENKSKIELFEDSVNKCQFYSMDLEMSGITLDLVSEHSEYDFPQLRYEKMKRVVKEYDVIQIGMSFYIPSYKISDTSKKNELLKEEVYLERTFTFYLYRSSPFNYLSKLYSDYESSGSSTDKKFSFSVLDRNIKASPETLKFLIKENFDFSTWVKIGLHYNKLNYADNIKQLFEKHVEIGRVPHNGVLQASKKAQERIVSSVIEVLKFLISPDSYIKERENTINTNNNINVNNTNNKINKDNKKKSVDIDTGSEFYSSFLVSLDISKFLNIKKFLITKCKDKPNFINVELSKSTIAVDEFFVNKELFNEYNTNLLFTLKNLFNSNKAEFIEEVKKVITYDRILCFKYKHLAILPSEILNCNDLDQRNALKEVFVTNMLRQELGFSLLIKKLIESKKPMVGHNMFFDVMFLYDKFIDDLPNTLDEFIFDFSRLFPTIHDTKNLSHFSGKFDKTGLSNLISISHKHKYHNYVNVFSDTQNGFCLYEEENEKNHDAGFDARQTGRSFIYISKAYENNFDIDFKGGKVSNGWINENYLNSSKLKNQLIFNIVKPFPFFNFDFNNFNSKLPLNDDLHLPENKNKEVKEIKENVVESNEEKLVESDVLIKSVNQNDKINNDNNSNNLNNQMIVDDIMNESSSSKSLKMQEKMILEQYNNSVVIIKYKINNSNYSGNSDMNHNANNNTNSNTNSNNHNTDNLVDPVIFEMGLAVENDKHSLRMFRLSKDLAYAEVVNRDPLISIDEVRKDLENFPAVEKVFSYKEFYCGYKELLKLD